MDYIPTSQKGIANGVATLDADTKVPIAQLSVIPIANGGTGNTTGNAVSATKLATARTIRTNLSSTSASSFNGTANITPGVTGTLPIASGGTGGTTVAIAKTNLGIKDPKRVARFVVGTSTAGWTAEEVDYLCDGVDDQVEINAAITALPATGGEVVILDWTYNLSGEIKINKSYITLTGNAQNTILKRKFNGSSVASGLIYITSSNNTIKFLTLYGNKVEYSSSNNTGIYIRYQTTNNMIINNVFDNNDTGISLINCGMNRVIGNTCLNNRAGIYMTYATAENNIINGNICVNNSEYGIELNTCNNNIISGNICNNNTKYGIYLYQSIYNTVTGNTCNNNNGGIFLYFAKNGTAVGNTCCNNNEYGIYMAGCKNYTIVGNTCIRGDGVTSDYTVSQHTIYVSSGSNNLIASNNIMGKLYTSSSSSGNTFINNKYE